MKGAVAAGHPLTAAAGARILAEGGNAVDACVAAALAAAVCESPLTGLGAGGFMLLRPAHGRRPLLADFFVSAPGLGGAARRGGEMLEVAVSFGDNATTQPFRIGCASVAVPGAVAGFEATHRVGGRLPWRELVLPACELAATGVRLTSAQAGIHGILDPILRSNDEGRRIYGAEGRALRSGELLRLSELGETLAELGRSGAEDFYRGTYADALVAAVSAGGGELTRTDLDAYRVIWRRPLAVGFAGQTVLTNPPPSAGGVLILYGLALLDRLARREAGSVEALVQLVEVMREQGRVRRRGFTRALRRGGLAGRLLAPAALNEALGRISAGAPGADEPAPPGGTTHISVLDRDGNVASYSSSTGSGSGVIVPGTGIYLNNMLGEDDLVGPRAPLPGRRLTSMMAPTVVVGPSGRSRLVVGSAGSARLRGAIMQVVVNVLAHGLDVADAIDAPRLHVEDQRVHCEGGLESAALTALAARGYSLVRWRHRNLFFGGVSAVEQLESGTVAAAGDPRRGGAGIVS